MLILFDFIEEPLDPQQRILEEDTLVALMEGMDVNSFSGKIMMMKVKDLLALLLKPREEEEAVQLEAEEVEQDQLQQQQQVENVVTVEVLVIQGSSVLLLEEELQPRDLIDIRHQLQMKDLMTFLMIFLVINAYNKAFVQQQH